MTKRNLILGAAISSALTSGVAMADLSGNAAASNNYIWRGVTQTGNAAAVSGGIDWSDASGLYVGTWIGDVDFTGAGGQKGYEMDVYAGFAGEAGEVGYDVGVITYQYPMEPNINFTEAYVTGSMGMVSVGAYFTVNTSNNNELGKSAFDEGDIYLNAALDIPTESGDVTVYLGSYMFTNDGDVGGSGAGELDYIHYGASLSKGDFTFALDKNDIENTNAFFADGTNAEDNVRFSVTWSKEFEL